MILNNIGLAELLGGDPALAKPRLCEGLELGRELGSRRVGAEALTALASLAAGEGDHDRAARLWGAAESLRMLAGLAPTPVDLRLEERLLASIDADDRHRLAVEEGRAMTFDEAVSYALASVD